MGAAFALSDLLSLQLHVFADDVSEVTLPPITLPLPLQPSPWP